MHRPRLLDLFCGAGGAALGYARAGFDVVGVDLRPQSRYPFACWQDDALEFVYRHGVSFDVIHASPPCQAFSPLRHVAAPAWDDLVAATRTALEATGVTWVIENVEGAPLIEPVTLCGTMFGLGAGGRVLKRHRLFESSASLRPPRPCDCDGRPAGGVYGDGGGGKQTNGYKFHNADARRAMGIDWMRRGELGQAIPPAYTEWLGRQLTSALPASSHRAAARLLLDA